MSVNNEITLGLQALNRVMFEQKENADVQEGTPKELMLEIFRIDHENELHKERLLAQQHKLRRWREICLVGEAVSIVFEFIVVAGEEYIYPFSKDHAIHYTKAGIVTALAFIIAGFAALSLFYHLKVKTKTQELEKILKELTPENKATIEKLQKTLEFLGKRAELKNDPYYDPTDSEIKEYIENVSKLESEVKGEPIPTRESWISALLQLLPKDHPILQKIHDILNCEAQVQEISKSIGENNLSDSSGSTSPADDKSQTHFENKGQQGVPQVVHRAIQASSAESQLSQIEELQTKKHQYWIDLKWLLGGLYVSKLEVPDENNHVVTIENTNVRNPLESERMLMEELPD